MAEISEEQLAANRANAQHSTGPKSEEGKQRSSLNATRHGLTGRAVVLQGEDRARYLEFSREIVDSFQPGTPMERELAQTVADQQWRLQRVRAIEEGLLEGEGGPAAAFRENTKALDTLSIYEQRIHRVMKDALRQLQEMQKTRKTEEDLNMREAIRLYRLNEMLGMPYDPQQDGFVCSKAELKVANERSLRHLASMDAMRYGYDLAKVKASLQKEGRI